MATAVKYFVRKEPLHHDSYSAKSNPGNHGKHANNSGSNNRSHDHGADGGFFELKRALVPGDFGARFHLLQQGVSFRLGSRAIDNREQRHRLLGDKGSKIW